MKNREAGLSGSEADRTPVRWPGRLFGLLEMLTEGIKRAIFCPFLLSFNFEKQSTFA